jgi:pimeloyl-ACP methyl ester carboxylesterase
LIGDALEIAAAVGHGTRRFHLVGDDWGGSLAGQIVDQHPNRLASLYLIARVLVDGGTHAAAEHITPTRRAYFIGDACWRFV